MPAWLKVLLSAAVGTVVGAVLGCLVAYGVLYLADPKGFVQSWQHEGLVTLIGGIFGILGGGLIGLIVAVAALRISRKATP